MKKILLLFTICSLCQYINANDSSFYLKGNQLIPLIETDISVQKEILTLKKIRNQFIEVTVYYEFYNSGAEKEIIVGFEAFQPDGDVDPRPKNGEHPHMRDFTVNLNNRILPYQVAHVENRTYVENGIIIEKSLEEYDLDEWQYFDFLYVYHFDAVFKEGLNIIKHTYNYNVSSSVYSYFDIEYVLTAANRWANNQIDDFTLIVDTGEFESFDIRKTFFNSSTEWLINGIGKKTDKIINGKEAVEFHIQKGTLLFQKDNFKPEGELFIGSFYHHPTPEGYLPFSYHFQHWIDEPKTDFERRVLRNLPFARRGYVFKSPELQTFYENLDWYIPNPNYSPDVEIMHQNEKEWLEKYK